MGSLIQKESIQPSPQLNYNNYNHPLAFWSANRLPNPKIGKAAKILLEVFRAPWRIAKLPRKKSVESNQPIPKMKRRQILFMDATFKNAKRKRKETNCPVSSRPSEIAVVCQKGRIAAILPLQNYRIQI